MAIRIYCTVPGLEENWIELPENWTRRDERAIEAAGTGEDFLSLLRSKATGLHLVTDSGTLDSTDVLTVDGLQDVDVRVDQFLASSMQVAILLQRRLGNFSGRRSSNGSETMKTTPPPN